MYCVYLTTYKGHLLPPYYVGSSSLKKIENGYHGSVASKEFQSIWLNELRENPSLFSTQILSKHIDRRSAVVAELEYQIRHNVVSEKNFINKSLAQPDGFFGMDVSGDKNPMYGRSRKGEKHKGWHNISAGLKAAYASGKHDALITEVSKRMRENNPAKDTETMSRIKNTWLKTGRGLSEKNGMFGKKSPMNGKKLYNDGFQTKCFIENTQPQNWTLGRHSRVKADI